MKKVTGILTTLLLLCFPAYSQAESLTDSGAEQKSKKIEIYFELGSYVIDSTYMSNGESIQMFFDMVKTYSTESNIVITEVEIDSFSSPDGDLTTNKTLALNRTKAISRYLTEECSIPASLIVEKNCGVAWDIMREHVMDSDATYKEAVVDIIDNVPAETWGRGEGLFGRWLTLVDSRNKHLMELDSGAPYHDMQKRVFPYLRKTTVDFTYIRNEVEPAVQIAPDSLFNVEPVTISEVKDTIAVEPSNEIVEVAKIKKEVLPRNPLFVVKTNLVGLALGVANIGLEVPFKDHFSFDGSVYYSPYTISNEWKIRLSMLQPEFRYWLSTPLEKHFFGLHAHVGLFNIAVDQWSRYQNSSDQPLWGFGLSYGYALYLSRAISLEFNVGAGYASLCYDTFYNVKNGAQYDYTERGYWGLTKAGISFNYIINRK